MLENEPVRRARASELPAPLARSLMRLSSAACVAVGGEREALRASFAVLHFADEVSLAHDHDPVAEADELRQVRGDQQDRTALAGELLDGGVDRHLGPDLDAPRRLAAECA